MRAQCTVPLLFYKLAALQTNEEKEGRVVILKCVGVLSESGHSAAEMSWFSNVFQLGL